MVFMQWSGELEVQNTTVDGQHKKLVDALNELVRLHSSAWADKLSQP